MSIFASLAIALSLFTGAPAISAPADAVLTYDSPAVEVVAADFTADEWAAMNPASADPQEDEPGWNCYEHGNRVCGPLHEGMDSEAWERFAPSVLPADIQAAGFKATYMGTIEADAPLLTDSWHTYHPSSIPGINHVFSIQL